MFNEIGDMMKQAKNAKAELEQAKRDIEQAEVGGEAGAGRVKIVMTGRHRVKKLTLDPALLKDDKDMLEDLIVSAVNDASRRVNELSQSKMSNLVSGMGLPAGFKLPF